MVQRAAGAAACALPVPRAPGGGGGDAGGAGAAGAAPFPPHVPWRLLFDALGSAQNAASVVGALVLERPVLLVASRRSLLPSAFGMCSSIGILWAGDQAEAIGKKVR